MCAESYQPLGVECSHDGLRRAQPMYHTNQGRDIDLRHVRYVQARPVDDYHLNSKVHSEASPCHLFHLDTAPSKKGIDKHRAKREGANKIQCTT